MRLWSATHPNFTCADSGEAFDLLKLGSCVHAGVAAEGAGVGGVSGVGGGYVSDRFGVFDAQQKGRYDSGVDRERVTVKACANAPLGSIVS